MRWYKADMHIHTVLSPCGGLDMSPVNIIKQAVIKGLDIIAITDHNSTRHCRISQQIGKKSGVTVLAGAEINSKEEIHCLTFFEDIDRADLFQQFIDVNLPEIPNNTDVFGNQFLVDEDENILDEENRLLIMALQVGIDVIAEKVRELNGIFIPAHVNRPSNSLFSQLGFIPPDLQVDAMELAVFRGSEHFLHEHPEMEKYCIVNNSDAHSLDMMGVSPTEYYLEEPGFEEIRLALKGEKGRKVRIL
jgi:3',5'-nucleoside bisphosphate phosphatase